MQRLFLIKDLLESIDMNICRPFRSGSILFLIGFLVCINSASDLASNGSEIRQFNLTDPRELGAFMDGVINAQLMAHYIPGATVAVVKDGKLIFAKGYGYADVDKRTRVLANETLFRVGSVSKLFVWTAVMQLAERGRLDPNADTNVYLKDFQIPSSYPRPITLKDLMTHAAGFEELATGGRCAAGFRVVV